MRWSGESRLRGRKRRRGVEGPSSAQTGSHLAEQEDLCWLLLPLVCNMAGKGVNCLSE